MRERPKRGRRMSRRRVVVTGLGMVTPLGNTVPETWEGTCQGRSGIRRFTHLDVSQLPVRFGGAIRDFDVTRYMSGKEARTMGLFIQYGMAAGLEAVADAGLDIDVDNAERVGVAVGAGIGGLQEIERTTLQIAERGPRRISPFYIPATIINMAAGQLSIRLGARGPNFSVVSACTTGAHNIGHAARLIQYDEADAMIAGGCEMATTLGGIGGFAAARALSRRNDEPEAASRPWDRDRDGFVLSDGAGLVVLEEYERARRRGARIYAEFAGYGMSADAYHMTAPMEDGRSISACMNNALRDAGLDRQDVSHVNAHATSTPLGDRIESRAIERVFGDRARKLAVSSSKSMLGHMLGAAGGVETALTILALYHQLVPPTINLENPDSECVLDYVPGSARELPIEAAMSNSFGFGGTNASLVFRRSN